MQTDWLESFLTDADALARVLGVVIAVLLVMLLLYLHARRRLATAAADAARAEISARHQAEELQRRGERIAALEPQLDNERQVSRDLALRAGQLDVRLDERADALSRLTEERDGLSDALFHAREGTAKLERDLAELRLAAQKDREAMARDIATLRDLRAEMTGQFRLMSQETLRSQGEDMRRVQSEQLSALLVPFRDQVHRFQTELQTRNKVLDEEGARLREQIEGLYRRSEAISREAVELTRALKGEKQRQGAWGEMILERILEDSGLQEGQHYDLQTSFRDEDRRGWRPDVVVRMPRGKVLVIDSKVSLNAYEQSVNAAEPADREAALRRHVAAIRAHITALSAKGYDRMDDASVDYVLMFIPIEGAFSEALRADPELASFALDCRIGLATPTTLMLTLRTVDHIWTVERRETNAMEIARRAGAVYDKVAGFVESLEAVGKALDGATRAHGQAMDRLTRGQGNVIRQVEMLRELGARTQKKIALDHEGGTPTLPEPQDDAMN
ncbi:MAG: DNA recombination protein RmuC [Paracoccus sp. (in: a-proteobacteria)]|uniref:DNA recombination protein RmuC n=1 Tax=Paracoccus sp. TaxID=267 RepID=UPI0026DF5179|nr:DNA recombination protein RmuC [Paracoccus sp. (in: a-proteobacteria)]MDO5630286.1 DNA recombination protein RmuC [Paracoccus sp. (in: a-proteobacteria)]